MVKPTETVEAKLPTNGRQGDSLYDKNMLVQSMETLLGDRMNEMERLQSQKLQLLNEINDAQKEKDRLRRSMSEDANAQRQIVALELSQLRTDLSQREERILRLERQFDSRDRELTSREINQQEALSLHQKMKDQSFEIEQLKAKTQQEHVLIVEKGKEWDGKLQALQSSQGEVTFQQASLRTREDAIVNAEADLDRRIKALVLQEQVVKQASSMLEPKMIELSEENKRLDARVANLNAKEESLSILHSRLNEAQEKIESDKAQMDERLKQISEQESLIRQRKLILLAEENKVPNKEMNG